MKKFVVSSAVALTCMLGVAAEALASATPPLPTFKSDLIVPGKSLGGVQLYSSYTSATRAFETGARNCSVKKGCSFQDKSGSSLSIVFAITKSRKTPFVGQISINAGPGSATPLASFKTASGIGLGSTAAAVKRAYPHVKGNPRTYYDLVVRGTLQTVFELADGRVSGISLQAIQLG